LDITQGGKLISVTENGKKNFAIRWTNKGNIAVSVLIAGSSIISASESSKTKYTVADSSGRVTSKTLLDGPGCNLSPSPSPLPSPTPVPSPFPVPSPSPSPSPTKRPHPPPVHHSPPPPPTPTPTPVDEQPAILKGVTIAFFGVIFFILFIIAIFKLLYFVTHSVSSSYREMELENLEDDEDED
jgi:hypothetical protein